MTNTLSDRLKSARKAAGLSQGELARRVKVSRAAVSQWENGTTQRIEGQNLLAASKALSVSPEWLSKGLGRREAREREFEVREPAAQYNNDKSIPIITWEQAGKWRDISHNDLQPQGWILTDGDFSNESFALIIDDDILTQDYLPKGTKIIVDPKAPAASGSIVIAKLQNTEKPTVKRLVIDGNTKYIQPLNSLFKPIEIDDEYVICGVIRRAITDYDAT